MADADEESEKMCIVNEIIRLESSTNDALRSSRDEIERLELVNRQKKDELKELENELNALIESRTKKKKRIPTLRPKRLRNLTVTSAGDAVEAFRRVASTESGRRGDTSSVAGTVDDDGASLTFTVATFEKTDDIELADLWNSYHSDGDASSFQGGESRATSNGGSNVGSVGIAKDLLCQKQALLYEKQLELEQNKERFNLNERKIQLMQQQLSAMQHQQNIHCDEHNSTVESLAEKKTDLIARIKWREARILEEEKNLAKLKEKLIAAKITKAMQPPHQSKVKSSYSNDDTQKLASLTKDCADLLTEFSSSVFKMIESTITLPPHSSISFSIGDPSDTSTFETKRKHRQNLDKEKSGSAIKSSEEKENEDHRELLELQKSEEQYDAKIVMIENEIKSYQATVEDETNANNIVLGDLEKQIALMNDKIIRGGDEIKQLVGELDSLNEKEQKLLELINETGINNHV